MFFNHKYCIRGTENVSIETIAVTTVLCSWYLNHAARGDTLDCFLGIYPIISPTTSNWSVSLAGKISQDVLEILPSKKVILPAIKVHLNELWLNEWSHLKGLRQTKFWLTKLDPILASKLINMSREDLGKCIQFFTGHGWWQKYLSIVNLSNNSQCRLCEEDGCEETPIHIFTECEALANTRMALFGVPYPTREVGRESLCQVVELIFVDTVRELMDLEQNSNVNLMD